MHGLFLLEEGLGYGLVAPFPAYGFATLVPHNENLNSPKQAGRIVRRTSLPKPLEAQGYSSSRGRPSLPTPPVHWSLAHRFVFCITTLVGVAQYYLRNGLPIVKGWSGIGTAAL